MSYDSITNNEEKFTHLAHSLNKIRYFSGIPSEFWPAYLNVLIDLVEAQAAIIIVRNKEGNSAWRQLAFEPRNQRLGFYAKSIEQKIEEVTLVCLEDDFAILPCDGGNLIAATLDIGEAAKESISIFFLKGAEKSSAVEKLKWLQLAVDVPQSYQFGRIAGESKARLEQLAGVLDFMAILNVTQKFLACVMVFCNEVSARLKCDCVSFGWANKGYIRLEAMSHVDHFDGKMERVQQIEAAMEECLDQDTEIFFPAPAETKFISRAHKDYSHAQRLNYICSLPLRSQNEPVAVCLCERNGAPFTETEIIMLSLLCQQAVSKLTDLKQNDRWFGARIASFTRKKIAILAGFEHTWVKVLAIILSLLLAFIIFVPLPFRVDAPLILKTSKLIYITASFDGRIDKVMVRVGDKVKQDDVLLVLDKKDLLLEEAALEADEARYQREFEKARAAEKLSEMRVAQSLQEQAAARLELVRYRLEKSVIKTPFDGFIVEGDMNERINAPVKKGDVLFKAARNERMYVELDVRESDIHYIKDNLDGEIALVSRPQDSYNIRISLIEPSAVPKDKGNIFIAHGQFEENVPEWWQPGMTGIGKINVGRRTLIWILTRRTIDFLRLRLWW